ncbi:MAG: 3-dehydroquinate synthase, partial [Kiritimatiellae bacterium]|nr:3-dehydroquinate synthase [Kiritimatiellia bacterium]
MTPSPRPSFAAGSLGGAASSRAGGAGAQPPSLGPGFAAAVPPAAGGAGAEPQPISIPVSASTPYTVLIGDRLLPSLPSRLSTLSPAPKSIVLVSDTNVAPLHAAPVISSLSAAGFSVHPYTIPAGEPSKTWATLGALLEFMAAARLTRSDLVLALGGGVVGDLAGFAAAVYRRGIRHIQIPTSLLAAVDSSVGGKTAVDLAAGKNQAGAFHQPSLVLCDTALLATLPPREWACGSAEVVKYALLGSPTLFSTLESLPPPGLSTLCGQGFAAAVPSAARGSGAEPPSLASIIAECVAMKASIVSRDEFETGDRMLLNLGHTIGHAVELLSDYAIPHGEAVSIGL